MGEQDPVAALVQVGDQRLQVGADRRERALEQHVAAAAERERGQLVVVELRQPVVRDLAAGQQLEVDPLVGEPRRQRVAAVGDLRGLDVEHLADMARRGDRARARRDRRPRHLQRRLGRRRPVVERGEDVGVQVDHGTP